MQGILTWGPAAIWAAVLFLLSASPGLPGLPWLPFADKLAHGFLYAVFGGTLAWGRERGGGRSPHAWFLLGAFLYGLSDEWHQTFVPGRDASLGDALADAVGVLVGYGFVQRRLRRRGGAPPVSTHPFHS